MGDPIEEVRALLAQWDRDEPHMVHVWPMREKFEALIAAARSDREALARASWFPDKAKAEIEALRAELSELTGHFAKACAQRDNRTRQWEIALASLAEAEAKIAAVTAAYEVDIGYLRQAEDDRDRLQDALAAATGERDEAHEMSASRFADVEQLRTSLARALEAMPSALTTHRGALELADERLRQMVDEKWSNKHDDGHDAGELAWAAACYITGEVQHWPFDGAPKFKDRRRDLVRAGALILAELARLDRLDAFRASQAATKGGSNG